MPRNTVLLRYEMIVWYVLKLSESFGGVHTLVSPEDIKTLNDLYKKKDFTEIVHRVARLLHLNARIRVKYVSFWALHNGAPAWILYSRNVPLRGTKEFENFQATVYFHEQFIKEAPFETLISSIAHELSHLVLSSIGHELEHDEVAVDLTAMILGFRNFYPLGCEYVVYPEQWCTRSYLHQLLFWFDKIFDNKNNAILYKIGYITFDEARFVVTLLEEMEKPQHKNKNN